MAYSARTAELLARRSRNLYNGSGSIRILAPTNSSISSIAKQVASNELDIMVSKYNSGMVSNQEMRDFLAKTQNNPGISAADKLNIDEQLREFDSRIIKDRLENVYKAAPDNSLQQVQALQNLSAYWKTKASTMQVDTPAYATANDNAAQYGQKIIDVNNSMQIQNRRNQGYIALQEINKIADPAERASKLADMNTQLYNQAITDGDTVAANQYLAEANKQTTTSQTLSDAATLKSNKLIISNYVNDTMNQYHSGDISGDQALAQLDQASSAAADIGDTATPLRITNLGITINREIDKGITYGPGGKSSGGGGGSDFMLNTDGSVSYGSVSNSSSGGSSAGGQKSGGGVTNSKNITSDKNGNNGPKSFAQLDFDYQQNTRNLTQAVADGLISPQEYKQELLGILQDRAGDVNNMVTGLNEIVSVYGVDSKLGGKAVTKLNTYQEEGVKVVNAYNEAKNGALAMVNKEVTDSAGNVSHKPTLQLVDKNSLNGWQNVNDVWYKPYAKDVVFGDKKAAEEFAKLHGQVVAQDNMGNFKIVDPKDTTKAYQQSYLDVTDTNGHVITYNSDPKYGWLPDRSKGPLQAQLHDMMKKEADMANANGDTYKNNLVTYSQLTNPDLFKSPVGTVTQKPVVEKTGFDKAFSDISGAVGKVINPVAPLMPAKNIPSTTQLGSSGQQAIQQAATTLRYPSNGTSYTTKTPTMQLATQQPSPVAKLTQQTKAPLVNIGTSPVKTTPAKPQQSLGPIDFFKKLLGWK